MAYCMDATTGDVRHDDYRDADYEVSRTEAFASANWCAGCVLEYIECGMGECIISVALIRSVSSAKAGVEHDRVVRELQKLGLECK